MRPLRVLSVVSILPFFGGCAGLLVDAIAKSAVTGGPYSEVSKSFPAVPAGYGRVYLYRTEASTRTTLKGNVLTGALLLKNPTVCSVGVHVHEVVWEAFMYIDVPEGPTEITCGDDVIGDVRQQRYRKGVNRLQLAVTKSAEHFVRVDVAPEPAMFKPVLVDPAAARAEMASLPIQDSGMPHTYQRGVLSE
ncbi:MAG: hypothetical protein KIT17_18675 [Rubrivivax sp.]|nr:hypothetical protein [Rubrivivax sp.]